MTISSPTTPADLSRTWTAPAVMAAGEGPAGATGGRALDGAGGDEDGGGGLDVGAAGLAERDLGGGAGDDLPDHGAGAVLGAAVAEAGGEFVAVGVVVAEGGEEVGHAHRHVLDAAVDLAAGAGCSSRTRTAGVVVGEEDGGGHAGGAGADDDGVPGHRDFAPRAGGGRPRRGGR
jgi:hypothetical protein